MATERPPSFLQNKEKLVWIGGFIFAFIILLMFGRIPRQRSEALVGKLAPDIPFVMTTGDKKSLRDYAGQVVLLNFWATWCAPCMEEMPALRELENQLGPRGFSLLAINVAGDDPKMLGKVPQELLPTTLIYRFQEESIDPYGVDVIPLSVLIDKEGNVNRLYLGPRDWVHPSVVGEIEKLL